MKKLILIVLLILCPFVVFATSEVELGIVQNWIITGLSKFPVFFWLFTVLATAPPLVSILHGAAKVVVKATPGDWDDNLLAKIVKFFKEKLTPLYKLGILLKRFSLFKNA